MNTQEAYARFKKLEPILTIFVWPLMLQITMKVFFNREIHYTLCFVAEFTLFGFFRIIGAGLGIINRPVIINQVVENTEVKNGSNPS
jgi:hypothetical protein